MFVSYYDTTALTWLAVNTAVLPKTPMPLYKLFFS